MSKQNNVFKDAYNRCLDLLVQQEGLPSEPEISSALGVSRTTVRAVLTRMNEVGLIEWNKRAKLVLRIPNTRDYFPTHETDSLSQIIERTFLKRILTGGARAGDQINELELARDIGVGTSAVREFLIRFSRFGLIEKRPNSHWVLKGFNEDFARELTEVREMFELRSASAFAQLDEAHPNWILLDEMEQRHHEVLDQIDERYMEFAEMDDGLHRLIHTASSNRFIVDFYDVIAMIFHYHYHWNKTNEKARNKVAIQEHLDYIAALKSHNLARVDVACRRHLKSARETLLASIQQGI